MKSYILDQILEKLKEDDLIQAIKIFKETVDQFQQENQSE